MRGHLIILAIVLAACVALPGSATTMAKITRTCPIGGEKYDSFEIMSTSSFGKRLDLRPIGPAAYLPTVECPNGFVVYKDEKDFTADEIAKLTPVVASAEYRRIRTVHMIAYRIACLRRALGAPERDLAWTLMRAAFQAEDAKNETLRQGYLTEARRAYEDLRTANAEHSDEWWTAGLLLAEIARQQGRFKDSVAAVDALPTQELPSDSFLPEIMRQIRAKAEAHDAAPAQIETTN
jgi:hypothetical protein